jgi:altronate dehydratase
MFFVKGGETLTEKINAILISSLDDVATAITELRSGDTGRYLKPPGGLMQIVIRQDIPEYHKFAVRDISKGEMVRKYGEIIGAAIVNIRQGCHVHDHNVASPVENSDRA